jgi:dihydrofolate synthase / folylpolyglutamate synthase
VNADVFFREWDRRSTNEDRSLSRAGELITASGLRDLTIPVVTVVGSKGKGTAATYASAYLVASGLRVVTITSPSFRSDRERIRVNGRAITAGELANLAGFLDDRISTLPDRSVHGGYLSPAGLFTIAGVRHAHSIDADVLILEAGRGGQSDEVSLLAPTVVGMTSIFAEHLGQIGRWIDAIAIDKAGAVLSTTRTVVSLPQTPSVWRTIKSAIVDRTNGRLEPTLIQPLSSGIPVSLLASGVSRANSELGICMAQRLLDVTTHSRPEARDLIPTLRSVRIPGRLSRHRVPGTATEILADSAINRAGIAATMTTAREMWGDIDHVIVCLPDHMDLPGAITELADQQVTFVRLPYRHLRFDRRLPAAWNVLDADDLSTDIVSGLGWRIVAVGTIYFIGRVLDLVEAETDRTFVPPSEAQPFGHH